MFSSEGRKKSAIAFRNALISRFIYFPIGTVAQVLFTLRFTVLCVIALRAYYMEEINMGILLVISVAYFTSVILGHIWTMAVADVHDPRGKRSIAIDPAMSSTEDRPDPFFPLALIDITYITLAGACLAGAVTETHLGFSVALAGGCLFRSGWRVLGVYAGICAGLLARWIWMAWLAAGSPQFSEVIVFSVYLYYA